MKYKFGLSFDLDETLLDGSGEREAIARTCEAVCDLRPGLEAASLLSANADVWRVFWPEVEDDFMLGRVDGASVSREAWRRTLRARDCHDEELARRAAEISQRYFRESLRLFDDCRGLLDSLSAQYMLALITNGAPDTQRDKLRTLGIEPRFGAVIISGEVGIAKPDPAIFDLALERLGVEHSRVWHVGDSLRYDVAGAKAAGLTAVWLNRGGLSRKDGDPKPDHEIRSLRELLPLLPLS